MNIADRDLLPVIRAALERGQRVRMTATGRSMHPFICDGDTIELEPLQGSPRIGDILQVERDGERAVVHRVVRLEGNAFFLRGDANTYTEGPFSPAAVLGKVTASCRNAHTRVHRRGFWRVAGLVWLRCAPLSSRIWQLLRRLRQVGI